jgi:hypothetical protein
MEVSKDASLREASGSLLDSDSSGSCRVLGQVSPGVLNRLPGHRGH